MNTQWQVNDKSPSPKWILDLFSNCYDQCPPNPKCDHLLHSWEKLNYVNPPYSNKVPWIKKAIEEMEKGNTTVMLLPQDTSAAWYHDLVIPNAEILSFRGRLELDSGKHGRYGSMLVIFHPQTTLDRNCSP